jgi:hypothetical protein
MTVNFKHHLLKIERKRKALETAREEFDAAILEAYANRDKAHDAGPVNAIAYYSKLTRQRIYQIVKNR